jgi:hypothetical protein
MQNMTWKICCVNGFLKIGTDVMVYPGGKLVQAVNFFLSFFFPPFMGFSHVDQTRIFIFIFWVAKFFPKN